MEMTPEQQKELQERIKNMSPEELREFQKQQCIFCHIISGKVQAKKVYEDEKCLAILDINPANPGHMLLLPKEHYSIMPLIPEEEIGHLFQVAKQLSRACLTAFKKEGEEGDLGTSIFVANGAMAGQRAQHFMAHVIPRKENDGVMGLELIEKTVGKSDLAKIKARLLGEEARKEEKVESKKEPKVVEAEFEEVPKEGRAQKKEAKQKKPQKPDEHEEESAEEEAEASDEEQDKSAQKEQKEEAGGHDEEDDKEGSNLDDIAKVLFK